MAPRRRLFPVLLALTPAVARGPPAWAADAPPGVAAPAPEAEAGPLLADDACAGGTADCGLSLLQRRGRQALSAEVAVAGNATAAAITGLASAWNELVDSAARRASLHLTWAPDLSYCLSTDGNRIGNGVKIQLWRCDQSWQSIGQNFFVDESGMIRLSQDPSFCVVVDGNRFLDGAQIQLWRCADDNYNQRWSFRDSYSGQIHARERLKCLVIDGNRPLNGAKIQLWSCSVMGSPAAVQSWVKVAHNAERGMMYAVPNADMACPSPWLPAAQEDDCVKAAEALRPGDGCNFGGNLVRWAEVVRTQRQPDCPRGCHFYGACQGGCSLNFNPVGHTDATRSCADEGNCFSITVICQLPLR
mmetsp:Transcript_76733/g.211987  ORF Transcript_76733/g.211987 Transcript_76733/m.211987 type:complete len:359 (-) Transcript_76733:92-1168(-)